MSNVLLPLFFFSLVQKQTESVRQEVRQDTTAAVRQAFQARTVK